MRIGIDLGGTKIEGAVLAPGGDVLARERCDTPRHDYDATVDSIARIVEALDGVGRFAREVGVGHPGAIDRATGLVGQSNSTWLNGRALRDDLERRLGRPVRCANDANCFALSEAIDGAATGHRIVFGVILGTGVGGGLVVDGRLVDGPSGSAGEWGHNPLPWPGASGLEGEHPGPPCYCGRRGCVESFLSGPGLAADFARGADGGPTAREIARLASTGHRAAIEALERYADRLGHGLASIVNVVDPDIVVFGGGLSALELIEGDLPRRIGEWSFAEGPYRGALVRANHGPASGVRGAARLWP